MNIVLLLLVGSVIFASFIACVLFLQRSYIPKLQFSLRGFLGLVAIVAIFFGCVIGYRRNYMAQLTWIPIAQEDATMFFPAAKVEKNADGRFEFVYYARNHSIQHLLAKNNLSNYAVTEEAVLVTSSDESESHDLLKRIEKSDTISDGAFVIRGRLRDYNGQPVQGARIDIMGAYQFINCFNTRNDGTFTLALSDRDPRMPGGGGFYFRIRAAKIIASNWNSPFFSLDSSNPVTLVDIQIPE